MKSNCDPPRSEPMEEMLHAESPFCLFRTFCLTGLGGYGTWMEENRNETEQREERTVPFVLLNPFFFSFFLLTITYDTTRMDVFTPFSLPGV